MWFMLAGGFMGIITGGFMTVVTLYYIVGGSWDEGGFPFIYSVIAGIFIIVFSHQVRRMAEKLGEGSEQARYAFSTLTGLACIGFALASMGNVLFLSGIPVFLVFTWSLNTAEARAWCSGTIRKRPRATPRVAGCLLLILSVPMLVTFGFEHSGISFLRYKSIHAYPDRWRIKQKIDILIGTLVRYNAMEPRPAVTLEELEGRYIKKVPVDPWGRPYYLDLVGETIGSCGPDGKRGTKDDIAVSYQFDPILMDVKFLDAGVVPVCFPNEQGILVHNDEWRNGPNGAPNEGRPGPGDIIELTFARPVWYGNKPWNPAHTASPVAVVNPSTGEMLPAEADLTGQITMDDFVITNQVVHGDIEDFEIPEEYFPYLVGFDVYSMYQMDFDAGEGQYSHVIYIPWGEPDTVHLILGDVQTIGDSDGDGVMEPLTIITPGEMYLNLNKDNTFIDRKADMNPVKPSARSMLLKFLPDRTGGK